MTQKIAYQGLDGAYSHLACQANYPDHEPLACSSFAEVFKAVRSGKASLAMIPVDNTVAGRVSDIYHLLPEGELFVVAERYLPVHHQLLGVKGTSVANIKSARSHPMALGQVRKRLATMGITAVADVDTAGAAKAAAELGDPSVAAIASKLAAEIYGLDILLRDIEDADHNTTRFLVLSGKAQVPALDSGPVVSSYVVNVRSVPSALYKVLGGFATNGLNLTKLESYMVGGAFKAAQFYIDVEGHPDSEAMIHAMDELQFFSDSVIYLGTYPAHSSRQI